MDAEFCQLHRLEHQTEVPVYISRETFFNPELIVCLFQLGDQVSPDTWSLIFCMPDPSIILPWPVFIHRKLLPKLALTPTLISSLLTDWWHNVGSMEALGHPYFGAKTLPYPNHIPHTQ